MLTIDPERCLLLVVDFQSRLMPAIHDGEKAVKSAARLIRIAEVLNIPCLFTEQNPKGLGSTVEELTTANSKAVQKLYFNACREDNFLDNIPADTDVVVAGCEAHVCVQQTVLGLLFNKRDCYVVRDGIGSRSSEDKETAIRRMERHGAEIVTSEMVIFEWLQSSANPNFREVLTQIK